LTTLASCATCFAVSSAKTFFGHASAPALAARANRYTNLPYSTAALNESAQIWTCCQPGLERPVIFIAEQRRDLPRKDESFDQLHVPLLSAIGG
jgi:hypothetical protein